MQKTHDALAAQGFRLLGVAYRQVPTAQDHACLDDESRLIFAGFAAFLDPPKADARRAVQALTQSGVTVKIVTGDNELVTRHICETVDEEDLRRPRRWDMKTIRRFMLVIGPVSSIFDFLTFYLMMVPFRSSEAAFHTGWFVESIATQVLVVFIIRTRGNPFRSKCSPWLAASSLAVVLLSVSLPFTPIASLLGFVPLPSVFLGALACIVVAYLGLVQIAKRILDRRTVTDT